MKSRKYVKLKKYKNRKNHYWTVEELKAVASKCKNRGEFYTKHKNAYMSAYQTGKLDEVCSMLPPSNKKRKYVVAYPNHLNLLGPVFSCNSLKEFRENYGGTYDAGLRFGIDFQELFENIEDVKYIKSLVRTLYENAAADRLFFDRPTRGDINYNKIEDQRVSVETSKE